MLFWRGFAIIGFGFILSLIGIALLGLSSVATTSSSGFTFLSSAYFQQILFFSFWQALLSTLISLFLGYLVARALYYGDFLPARKFMLALCLLCFVFPTLVLITALALLLGHNGLILRLIEDMMTVDTDWNIYGLSGILIAHVFLNAPYAIRVFYIQLNHIPDSSWQLARQLKITKWQQYRLIEWPMLKSSLFSLAVLIFTLCFNSFAIVLALGGGPKSTTLEVAIFQALKYDFNITEAMLLSWVQFIIIALLFVLSITTRKLPWITLDTQTHRYVPKASVIGNAFYLILYSLMLFFLLLPMGYLIFKFGSSILHIDWITTWNRALFATVTLSILSTLVALLISYCILYTIRAHTVNNSQWSGFFNWLANIPLMTPAMVLSVGLFIVQIHYFGNVEGSIFAVILINSLLVIPFVVAQWRPRLAQYDQQYIQLIRSLKLTFWQRFTIEWRYCKQARNQACILSLLLCMGDVAVIQVLGPDNWTTLPVLIYQYASHYQLDSATVLSVILLCLYFSLILLFQRQQAG